MNPMRTILKTANAMRGSNTEYKNVNTIDLSDMENDDITAEIEKTLAECAKTTGEEGKKWVTGLRQKTY